jgi:hypothetical protein
MNLEKRLKVGAKIKLGSEYCKNREFKAGDVITLIHGEFEFDNGLYSTTELCPAIWNEKLREFDSIYHLFGNNLEDFSDCEIVEANHE